MDFIIVPYLGFQEGAFCFCCPVDPETKFGASTATFPTRGARLANAGMQQMTPRTNQNFKINTRGQFEDVEQTFKFWVSGSEAGRHMLWSAWGSLDYNANGLVSLAEIDKWIVETYPKLNNKPARHLDIARS